MFSYDGEGIEERIRFFIFCFLFGLAFCNRRGESPMAGALLGLALYFLFISFLFFISLFGFICKIVFEKKFILSINK